MPKSVEDVLQAFYQQKYAEIIGIIEIEDELVNSVDVEFGSSLLQLAIEGSEPGDETQELIAYTVRHPKFNIAYKKPGDDTNLGSIVFSARADVLALVIKNTDDSINPKSLINEGQLTYVLAKRTLAIAEIALGKDLLKNPISKTSERGKVRVAQLKEMVSMLRDATIMHAMVTDNADLLTQLDKASGEPASRLGTFGGGQLPNMLVKKENTNIRAWYKSRFDRSSEILASSSLSLLATLRETRDTVEHKENKLATLEKDYLAKKTEIHKKAIESTAAVVSAVTAALT